MIRPCSAWLTAQNALPQSLRENWNSRSPVDAQELLEEGAGFQLKVRLMEGQIDAVVLVVGNVLGAGVHPGVEILQAGNVLRRYAGEHVADDLPVKHAAHLVNLALLLFGEGIHHDPALRIEGNEAFRLKFQQGVAQRRLADIEGLGQLVEADGLAGGDGPLLEIREDPLVNSRPQKAGIRIQCDHAGVPYC